MRSAGRTLLLISLAWAAGAPSGWADAGSDAGPPVRLVAPRAGATLVAGTTAELEWEPLAAFDRLPEVEEWEAFLSLDGGVTYPMRITPHLDQDLRRVRWQVPALPTSNARLLLRFGDERAEETAVELPQQLRIVAPAATPAAWTDPVPPAPRASPGEAARPGQAGVVAWVEGSRRGGGLRQRIAAQPLCETRPGAELSAGHGESAETVPQPFPTTAFPSPSYPPARPFSRRAALAGAGTAPDLPSSILLLTQRQNE